MNILIVDDEVLVADSLVQTMDWQALGISRAYSAYNIRDARAIIEKNCINIILCDIEMPMGSGIQLLEWMRNNGDETEFIFLTCHEDFGYAQKALKYGCTDYLLKPVEFPILAAIIVKTVKKIREKEAKEKHYHYGKSLAGKREKIITMFWREMLLSPYKMDAEAIVKQGERYDVVLDPAEEYILILFCIKYRPISGDQNERYIIQFALDNLGKDIFTWPGTVFAELSEDTVVVVVPGKELNEERISERCYQYIDNFYDFFSYKLAGYVGSAVLISRLPEELHALKRMDQSNVSMGLFYHADVQSRIRDDRNYRRPNLTLWKTLLEAGQLIRFREEMNRYYEGCLADSSLTPQNLIYLTRDLDQLFFKVLEEKNIKYQDDINSQTEMIYGRRMESWENIVSYVDMVLTLISDRISQGNDLSAIEKVKEYISRRIDQEITREELANLVFLNQDYLSRAFKKKEGVSLKEYIVNQKMEIAKELLALTDISVSEIGVRVGYYNFAHFSTSFKKYTGMTPGVYRQKYGSL